ncbi:MAG: glycosyltransferase family 4 protein [bacterium]
MNIWLIQTGEVLPIEEDVCQMRTSFLADKLIERGQDVLWWASAFDHFKKDWIVRKDTEIPISKRYKIFVLKGIGYRKNISLSRFIDHRIVAWKFKKLAPKMPMPDVIVASMPPHDLAYEVVMFAKKYDIPLLVDIRDPWPDILLNHTTRVFRGLAKAMLQYDFHMIRTTMQMADGLIAVTDTFLGWGLRYAKRDRCPFDKIYPLGYKRLISSDTSEVSERFLPLLQFLNDKFIVFFVGTISEGHHDPSILIKAAEKFKEDKRIHFMLAGDGELFGRVKEMSVNLPNVTLTGWLNQNEIEFWLQRVMVGICPATKNVDLPTNKAFIYLSAGLPIISAWQGELKETIEKDQIGFYYPPNNVDALVNCIINLYNNPEIYKNMSENAKRVFDELFDADKIYTEYAEHIENVAIEYRKRG